MDDKRTYPKWTGEIMALFLAGSAHFLTGRRMAGLAWHFGTLAALQFGVLVAVMAGDATGGLAILPFLAALALWCVMLTQSYRPVPRIGALGWVVVIVAGVGLNRFWAWNFSNLAQTYRISSASMAPTIVDGDWIFVEKLSLMFGDPERGEIVVFRTDGIPTPTPGTEFVMRIAGLPGDRIRIHPPNLIVNGQVLTTPPVFKKIASSEPPFNGFQLVSPGIPGGAVLSRPTDEIVLGPDEYFVLGDNTPRSRDSRCWGPLPRQNITGRVKAIFWPPSRADQPVNKE